MAYQPDQCIYGMNQDQPGMFYHPHMHHNAFSQPTVTNDMMLGYHGVYDHYEFLARAHYMDEYDDGHEVTTRPRLTREQQDLLEREFQKNPKPSSALKRTLSVHTNLTLARVAVSNEAEFMIDISDTM